MAYNPPTPWTRETLRDYIATLRRKGPYPQATPLSNRDLSGLDLSGLDFSYLALGGARFVGSNLSGANFYSAVAVEADFTNANLSGAKLAEAVLDYADFTGADLSGANLLNANLKHATLAWATPPARPVTLPEGGFTAYKQVNGSRHVGPVILQLRIPATAQRVSTWVGRKCRASEAFVVGAMDEKGNEISVDQVFLSYYEPTFFYRVRQSVVPNHYDPDPRVVCSNGIHFFMTFEEAVAYNF